MIRTSYITAGCDSPLAVSTRVFDETKGVVMVDEKWFYKYKQGQKYYHV